MKTTIEIFLCYAHEDEKYRQGLRKQLRALQRQDLIHVWNANVLEQKFLPTGFLPEPNVCQEPVDFASPEGFPQILISPLNVTEDENVSGTKHTNKPEKRWWLKKGGYVSAAILLALALALASFSRILPTCAFNSCRSSSQLAKQLLPQNGGEVLDNNLSVPLRDNKQWKRLPGSEKGSCW